jgi:uncharacterized repeat protein (TIGR04138 family)
MGDELILDEDVPCERCGYNLRGLPTYFRCPECGTPYDESTEFAVVDAATRAKARRVGCRVDTMVFVQLAIRRAVKAAANAAGVADGVARPAGGAGVRHISAHALCRGFRDLIVNHFRDPADAAMILSAWGLRRSEDLGRIVFDMARAGLLRTSDRDSPADFEGLFTLDDLFTSPHPRLDGPVPLPPPMPGQQ